MATWKYNWYAKDIYILGIRHGGEEFDRGKVSIIYGLWEIFFYALVLEGSVLRTEYEMKKKTTIFKNLFWIIKKVYKYDKKYLSILLISIFITGLIPPISTLISQGIINGLQVSVGWHTLIIFIFAYVGLDLFAAIYNYFIVYYKSKFTLGFNLDLNENILSKASKLDLKTYEDSETYDKINRAQYEGNGQLLLYLENFTGIFSKIITMVSYLIILMAFRPWIVLCIIVIPVVKFLINRKINLMSFNLIKSRTNDSRKSSYMQYLVTRGDSFKELKTYNLFDYFIKRYKEYLLKFNNDDLKLQRKSSILLSMVTVFEVLIDGGLFSYIVYNGYSGKILIGNVMTYMKTITQIKDQMDSILQVFSSMSKDSLFIDQLIEFFALPEVNNDNMIEIDHIDTIKIVDLSYKYKKNQNYVLKNINLDIHKNEVVAIIGENGSGKTTLIKILMGFYDDYQGQVYINGIELRKIDKQSLLNNMATVFQDFVKYEATFRENIAYGNINMMKNDSVLFKIASIFGIDKLIKNSNNDLDCQIGCWFDNGKQVSIGQWQKIALSRAFIKKANLYILDEPNAALDAISEFDLSKSYSHILKDSMGIIVAHKFNNFIKNVDNIIILSNGEKIGEGNHADLIKTNSTYRKLYDIQVGNTKNYSTSDNV